VAVIVCVPCASAEVVSVATLPPPTAAVPRLLAPSKNCTVPVGVAPLTVAVNVTDWPSVDGFCDDVSAVVVAPAPAEFTT